MNVEVGTKVLDQATGVKTYSLPASFNPKVLIVWATNQNSAAFSSVDGCFGYGFATARGGQRQAAFTSFLIDPANTASRDSRWSDYLDHVSTKPTLLSIGATPNAATIDWEIDFDGFGTAEWRIDLTNAPALNGVLLHYIVLGGDDITDAYAGELSLATSGAAQDFTIASGFGQPDLLHFMSMNRTGSVAAGEITGNVHMMIGWAISETSRRCQLLFDQDAAGTMVAANQQTDKAGVGVTSTPAADWDIDLGARAGWPTDGFELAVADLPVATTTIYYLALKGTFQKKIGSNLTPTGAPSQVQDNDATFVPKLGLIFGHVMGTGTGIQRGGDAAMMFVGATDGTNEADAGFAQDDPQTASDGKKDASTTKVLRMFEPSPSNTLRASADGAFSGNNVRLTFDTTDATGRQYSWLALGDAVVVPTLPFPRRDRSLAAQGQMV